MWDESKLIFPIIIRGDSDNPQRYIAFVFFVFSSSFRVCAFVFKLCFTCSFLKFVTKSKVISGRSKRYKTTQIIPVLVIMASKYTCLSSFHTRLRSFRNDFFLDNYYPQSILTSMSHHFIPYGQLYLSAAVAFSAKEACLAAGHHIPIAIGTKEAREPLEFGICLLEPACRQV